MCRRLLGFLALHGSRSLTLIGEREVVLSVASRWVATEGLWGGMPQYMYISIAPRAMAVSYLSLSHALWMTNRERETSVLRVA